MSARSKVVSDKTEFFNFQPDKCPMSGAISRLGNLSTWKCSNMIIALPQLFRGKAHAFFTRYIFFHIFTSENMENTSVLVCGLQYR